MSKLPVTFEVESVATPGIEASWNSKAGSLPNIECSVPPEFGGSGKGYTPEDFFALSVLNCIIATFKVYCEKGGLHFESLTSSAKVTMNKHPSENCLHMSELDITISVTQSSNPDKMKETLDRAIKDCAVSNSIKSGKTFHLHVS